MTTDAGPGGREMDRVAALAAQLTAAVGHELPAAPDGSQVRLVPKDWELQRLKPLAPPLPPHVSQMVTVDEAESFVLYFDAFKMDETRLFADVRHGTLTAVFDYHADDEPGRCAHRMVYPAPKSVEWQRWSELHRRAVDQEALLEFLEENAQDIAHPAAGAVLDFVSEFRSIRATKFSRKMSLADGTMAVSFSDEETGDQTVRAPSELLIRIPVFEGGERVEVRIYLRTRTTGGKLAFLLVIHRKELIERELFRELVRGIEERVEQSVWWGRIS